MRIFKLFAIRNKQKLQTKTFIWITLAYLLMLTLLWGSDTTFAFPLHVFITLALFALKLGHPGQRFKQGRNEKH